MHTALETPAVDCTDMIGTALSFKFDVHASSADTVFTVEISTDGGADWITVWQRVQPDPGDLGPQTANIDISETADGRMDVLLRFRYQATDAEEWGWQVDDVIISADKKNQFNWFLFLQAIIAKPVL